MATHYHVDGLAPQLVALTRHQDQLLAAALAGVLEAVLRPAFGTLQQRQVLIVPAQVTGVFIIFLALIDQVHLFDLVLIDCLLEIVVFCIYYLLVLVVYLYR